MIDLLLLLFWRSGALLSRPGDDLYCRWLGVKMRIEKKDRILSPVHWLCSPMYGILGTRRSATLKSGKIEKTVIAQD